MQVLVAFAVARLAGGGAGIAFDAMFGLINRQNWFRFTFIMASCADFVPAQGIGGGAVCCDGAAQVRQHVCGLCCGNPDASKECAQGNKFSQGSHLFPLFLKHCLHSQQARCTPRPVNLPGQTVKNYCARLFGMENGRSQSGHFRPVQVALATIFSARQSESIQSTRFLISPMSLVLMILWSSS